MEEAHEEGKGYKASRLSPRLASGGGGGCGCRVLLSRCGKRATDITHESFNPQKKKQNTRV